MSTADLVSAAELHGLLDDPATVVLDVRHDTHDPDAAIAAHRAGRIPGARFVDFRRDLSRPPRDGDGRLPLPDATDFERTVRALGVSADSRVVAYDARTGAEAARVWWLLRHHGHDAVSVLDGGYAAWRSAALPVETTEPRAVAPGDFVSRERDDDLVDADELRGLLPRLGRGTVLIDARHPRVFRGEESVDPVPGHIPGAANVFWVEGQVRETGLWLAPERQRERHRDVLSPGDDVVVYCGSGVSAIGEVLALSVAGIRARVYADGWSQWSLDPDRPVATGDDAP